MDINEAFSLLSSITDPSDVVRKPYEDKKGMARIVLLGGFTHTAIVMDPRQNELIIQMTMLHKPASFFLARGNECKDGAQRWFKDLCVVSMAREAKKSLNKRKKKIFEAMQEANISKLHHKGKLMQAVMPLDTTDPAVLKERIASMMKLMEELGDVIPIPRPKIQQTRGHHPPTNRIRCQYCGSAVIPDKGGKCPNCGAPLL